MFAYVFSLSLSRFFSFFPLHCLCPSILGFHYHLMVGVGKVHNCAHSGGMKQLRHVDKRYDNHWDSLLISSIALYVVPQFCSKTSSRLVLLFVLFFSFFLMTVTTGFNLAPCYYVIPHCMDVLYICKRIFFFFCFFFLFFLNLYFHKRIHLRLLLSLFLFFFSCV